MAKNMTTELNTTRDPIDWAVVGVFVGIAALLLTIEQKVEARTQEANRAVQEKAANGNRVRLTKLYQHVATLRSLASSLPDLGEPQKHPDRPGIRGTSTNLHSDETEERYLRIMDEVGNILGRINRLCSELDLDGFPLTTEDEEKYIRNPLSDIEGLTMNVLDPYLSRDERFQRLDTLLSLYMSFVEDLAALVTPRSLGDGLAQT